MLCLVFPEGPEGPSGERTGWDSGDGSPAGWRVLGDGPGKVSKASLAEVFTDECFLFN